MIGMGSETMRTILAMLLLANLGACQTTHKAIQAITPKKKTASEIYHERQQKLFDDHTKELVKLGRVSEDFDAYTLLGQYGWHTRADIASVGSEAPLWVLQSSGDEGAFGAYTFYPPAFEQAKRTWVVDAFMLPDSDLLWIRNRNIKFDKSVIGRTIDFLSEDSCWKDDGNTPCEEGWSWKDQQLRDAKVIDVFGHTYEYQSWGSDGSHERGPEYWAGPLRLDKKAPAFMQQYRIIIKPSDWVDMCACTLPSAPFDKPCVQGGTFMPGESCSVGIYIPIK
jgi:hypothetical protein